MGGNGIAGQSGLSTWITYHRSKQRHGRAAGASTQGSGSATATESRATSFHSQKTWWALIGVPKTSRDTKKDCEKPGCPSDHPGQGARPWRRGDRMSATSSNGTKRTSQPDRRMSAFRGKAE